MMSPETKIAIYRKRQQLLYSRGPHNMHIIAKIERKIRALQKEM